ncbi:MAG: TetR family transcriptional regulator, partial [Aquabacterium sp.]|nr:TetR family transcriptional regulator [Aquabacterium sp.]
VHAKINFVIRHHLITLLADGSGMCALVLGEGRATGPDLANVITECKRRYIAPLMDCLAQAREDGEIRQDMPLRLIRDLIYGSMEHVLWDSITDQKRPSIDQTAEQLTALVWSAITPPNASLEALTRFRDEVRQALLQTQQAAPSHSS